MSETLYNVLLRGKEYKVYVYNSSGPMTSIRFNYNKTELDHQVFLPSELEYQNINRILTESVKKAIYDYNRRMKNKRMYV